MATSTMVEIHLPSDDSDTEMDNQVRRDSCPDCDGTDLVTDNSSGDLVCRDCGSVLSERLISDEAEYRVFADDSESRKKIHYSTYNPFQEYSLTEKTKLERDEREFLWEGLKNIDDSMFRLFQGGSNTAVLERARELFQKQFNHQVLQKKGKEIFKPKSQPNSHHRQRFSRRKQFVVSSIYKSLQENNIKQWSLFHLSDAIGGVTVTEQSLTACLKHLNELESKSRQARIARQRAIQNAQNFFDNKFNGQDNTDPASPTTVTPTPEGSSLAQSSSTVASVGVGVDGSATTDLPPALEMRTPLTAAAPVKQEVVK